MRRACRMLLNALTVLSLLLCLAFAGLWVRSYWREDVFSWAPPVPADTEGLQLRLASGRSGAAITVGILSPKYATASAPGGWDWSIDDRPPIRYARAAPANRSGFGYVSYRGPDYRFRMLIFPTWLLTALFVGLPLARGATHIRRRRRIRADRCKNCGYDLRATPDRCPECGHLPATR